MVVTEQLTESATSEVGGSTDVAQLEAGRVDEVVVKALRLLQEREELSASHRSGLRAQIAEGVAAEERGELRDGREAVADVRRRIDERLCSGE